MPDPTRFIPDGSCTLSKRPAAFPSGVWDEARAQVGPWVCGQEKKYLDLVCALGALTVGNHDLVVSAVRQQMVDGAIFSLPHRLEGHVAERLCGVIPCAEQVKFVKTGSESTSAAVRISRIATGRQRVAVLKGHYHGWHDWTGITAKKAPGIPGFMYEGVASYLNAEHLLDLRPSVWGVLAAVIVEPERVEAEREGFLAALVDQARANGTIVIFDEMLSGGRLRVGGAQELYGVTPDLATFGKAFGGGLPLAFVCGRRDLMQHAWPVSGTFSGDALALAACDAMLDLYTCGERFHGRTLIGHLWATGLILKSFFDGQRGGRLGLEVHGLAPRFWLSFAPEVDRRLVMSIFVQQMAQRGVLCHQAVTFANGALSPLDMSEIVVAMNESWQVILHGLANQNMASLLIGEPYQDSVR